MTHKPWLSLLGLLFLLTSMTGCAMLQQTGLLPPERSAISPYGYFERVGPMQLARGAGYIGVQLKTGKVLIAGGSGTKGRHQQTVYVNQAELYDPKTKKFTLTDSFHEWHYGSYVLLNDGKVFFNPDPNKHADIYNPFTEKFEVTESLKYKRFAGWLFKLNDGNVLVYSGYDDSPTKHAPEKLVKESTEIYDIKTNTFYPGPSAETFKKTELYKKHMNDEKYKFCPSFKLENKCVDGSFLTKHFGLKKASYVSINLNKRFEFWAGGSNPAIYTDASYAYLYDRQEKKFISLPNLIEKQGIGILIRYEDKNGIHVLIPGGFGGVTKFSEVFHFTYKETT